MLPRIIVSEPFSFGTARRCQQKEARIQAITDVPKSVLEAFRKSDGSRLDVTVEVSESRVPKEAVDLALHLSAGFRKFSVSER